MSRQTLKLHPYIDGIREIVLRYDSTDSKLEVSSRSKMRIVVDIESLSSGLLESSSRKMRMYGPSDQESSEPERVLSRPRFTLDDKGPLDTASHDTSRRKDSPE